MNLSIKNADPEDVAAFNRIKNSLGEDASAKDTLAHIIKLVTQQQQGGNPQNSEKLTTLTDQVTKLTGEVTQVTRQRDELQQQCDGLQQQVSAAATLQENEFIVSPGPKLAAAITSVQEAFYTNELTKNTDRAQYRNEIGKYGIRFLIENTFLKKHVK